MRHGRPLARLPEWPWTSPLLTHSAARRLPMRVRQHLRSSETLWSRVVANRPPFWPTRTLDRCRRSSWPTHPRCRVRPSTPQTRSCRCSPSPGRNRCQNRQSHWARLIRSPAASFSPPQSGRLPVDRVLGQASPEVNRRNCRRLPPPLCRSPGSELWPWRLLLARPSRPVPRSPERTDRPVPCSNRSRPFDRSGQTASTGFLRPTKRAPST